jgi:hypothetical protein
MERDRVNLGWSVSVQKRQQIVETVAARHRNTLHYCLSRYGIVSQSLQSPQVSLRHLSPCGLVPIARRRRSAPLKPNAVDPDLAFWVRVLASVGSPPNLIQDFASLSIRPRTLGSLMNEERRHSRFRGRGTLPPAGGVFRSDFHNSPDGRRRDPRAEASMIRRLLVPAAFAQGGGAPGHLGTPEQQRACRPDVQRFCREMQNQGDYAIAAQFCLPPSYRSR